MGSRRNSIYDYELNGIGYYELTLNGIEGWRVVIAGDAEFDTMKKPVIPAVVKGKPVISAKGFYVHVAERVSGLYEVDLSDFDMTNVVELTRMFMRALMIDRIIWGKKPKYKIMDINYMFFDCESIREIDLSGFDLSEITSLDNFACFCMELTKVNLGNLNWGNLTNCADAFAECCHLENLDINCTKVTNRVENLCRAFSGTGLKHIDLGKLKSSNRGLDARGIVFECEELDSLILPDNNEVRGEALNILVTVMSYTGDAEMTDETLYNLGEIVDLTGLKNVKNSTWSIEGIFNLANDIDTELIPKVILCDPSMRIKNTYGLKIKRIPVKNRTEGNKVAKRLLKLTTDEWDVAVLDVGAEQQAR